MRFVPNWGDDVERGSTLSKTYSRVYLNKESLENADVGTVI